MEVSEAINNISSMQSCIASSKEDIAKAIHSTANNFEKLNALPENEQRKIRFELLKDYVKDRYTEEYKKWSGDND